MDKVISKGLVAQALGWQTRPDGTGLALFDNYGHCRGWRYASQDAWEGDSIPDYPNDERTVFQVLDSFEHYTIDQRDGVFCITIWEGNCTRAGYGEHERVSMAACMAMLEAKEWFKELAGER